MPRKLEKTEGMYKMRKKDRRVNRRCGSCNRIIRYKKKKAEMMLRIFDQVDFHLWF